MHAHHNRLAVGGLILALPALTLCTLGLLQSLFGLETASNLTDTLGVLIHPVVILGGVALAFFINLWPALDVDYQSDEEAFSLKITVRRYWSNLSIVGLTLLLVSIIFVYLLAENFGIFQGLRGG